MTLSLSGALATASMVAFLAARWNGTRVKRASKWAQTPGRIMVARIQEEDEDGVTRYRPEIVYRYQVDGGNYRNDRICFGGIGTESDTVEAELYLEAFPEDSETVVYYDPKNPSSSVLRVQAEYANRTLYVAAFVLLAFSGYTYSRNL
jgi:hypothetical protein